MLQAFREYGREHLDDMLDDLSGVCALPSVAGRTEALQATAEWVAAALEQAGLSARLLSAGGPPVVWAERLVPGKPTVLFYDHYDVQPAGDEEEWRFPPFAPRRYRRRFYARGAVDNKGNLVARLWALRAWQELHGAIPVGVRFMVEGEEEVGSPHLADFLDAHADRLRADGCVWEAGDVGQGNRPFLYMGMKGVLSVELEARGAATDLHSGWATIAPNPAWRLTWALSRLKSADEEVLIQGFYDDVEGPTHQEVRRSKRLPFPVRDVLEAWELPSFLLDMSGGSLLLAQFYSPTCNISGMESGHMGEGIRTIIPAAARARLDFRLVPHQRPEAVLQQLKEYLAEEGFGDLAVRPLGPALAPFQTPMDHPFVQAVVEASAEAFGCRPAAFPLAGGSGPIALLGEAVGLPIVSLGVGHSSSNVHGANENIRLGDLQRGVVQIAAILGRLAEGLSS